MSGKTNGATFIHTECQKPPFKLQLRLILPEAILRTLTNPVSDQCVIDNSCASAQPLWVQPAHASCCKKQTNKKNSCRKLSVWCKDKKEIVTRKWFVPFFFFLLPQTSFVFSSKSWVENEPHLCTCSLFFPFVTFATQRATQDGGYTKHV